MPPRRGGKRRGGKVRGGGAGGGKRGGSKCGGGKRGGRGGGRGGGSRAGARGGAGAGRGGRSRASLETVSFNPYKPPSTSSEGRSSFNSECARLPIGLFSPTKQIRVGTSFQATDLPECSPFSKKLAEIKDPANLMWSRLHCPLKEGQILTYLEYAKSFFVDEEVALASLVSVKYNLPEAFDRLPNLKNRENEIPLTFDEKAVFERIIFRENRLNAIKEFFPKSKRELLNQHFYNEMNFEQSNYVSAFMLPKDGEEEEEDSSDDDSDDSDDSDSDDDEEEKERKRKAEEKRGKENIVDHLMNRFMNMDAKCPKTITPDDYVITPPVAATFMHWIVHPANQPEANYLNADQLKAVRELRRQRVRLREMGQRQTQTINRKLGSLCGASEYFMQYYTILHHKPQKIPGTDKLDEFNKSSGPGWRISEVMLLIEWIRRRLNPAGTVNVEELAKFLISKTADEVGDFFRQYRKVISALVYEPHPKTRVKMLYQWFTDGIKLDESDEVYFAEGQREEEADDEEEKDEEEDEEGEEEDDEIDDEEEEEEEEEYEQAADMFTEGMMKTDLVQLPYQRRQPYADSEVGSSKSSRQKALTFSEKMKQAKRLQQYEKMKRKLDSKMSQPVSERKDDSENMKFTDFTFTSTTPVHTEIDPHLVETQHQQRLTEYDNEPNEASNRAAIDFPEDSDSDESSSKELIIDESREDSDSLPDLPEDKPEKQKQSQETQKDAKETALPAVQCGIEQYLDPISDDELASPESEHESAVSATEMVSKATTQAKPLQTSAQLNLPINPKQSLLKTSPSPMTTVPPQWKPAQQSILKAKQVQPSKPPEPAFDPQTAYLLNPEIMKSLPKIPRLTPTKGSKDLQPKSQEAQPLYAPVLQTKPPPPPPPQPLPTKPREQKGVNITHKSLQPPPQSRPAVPTPPVQFNPILNLSTVKIIMTPTMTTTAAKVVVSRPTTAQPTPSANTITASSSASSSITLPTTSLQKRPATSTTTQPSLYTYSKVHTTFRPSRPVIVANPVVTARPTATSTSAYTTAQTPSRSTVANTAAVTTTQPSPSPTTSKLVATLKPSSHTAPITVPINVPVTIRPPSGAPTGSGGKIFIQQLPPGLQMRPGMYQVTLPASSLITSTAVSAAGGSPNILSKSRMSTAVAGSSSHSRPQPKPQTISILTKKSSPSGKLVALSTVPIVIRQPPPPPPAINPVSTIITTPKILTSFESLKLPEPKIPRQLEPPPVEEAPIESPSSPVHCRNQYEEEPFEGALDSAQSPEPPKAPPPKVCSANLTTTPLVIYTSPPASAPLSEELPAVVEASKTTAKKVVKEQVPAKERNEYEELLMILKKKKAELVDEEKERQKAEAKAKARELAKEREKARKKERAKERAIERQMEGLKVPKSAPSARAVKPPAVQSALLTAPSASSPLSATTNTTTSQQPVPLVTAVTPLVAGVKPKTKALAQWYTLNNPGASSGDLKSLKLHADQLKPLTPSFLSSASTGISAVASTSGLQPSAVGGQQATTKSAESPGKQKKSPVTIVRKSIISASTYKSLGLEPLKAALGTSGPGSKSASQLLEETKEMVDQLGKDLDRNVRKIWAKEAYDNRHTKPLVKRRRVVKKPPPPSSPPSQQPPLPPQQPPPPPPPSQPPPPPPPQS